jgi:hypothetical protein
LNLIVVARTYSLRGDELSGDEDASEQINSAGQFGQQLRRNPNLLKIKPDDVIRSKAA